MTSKELEDAFKKKLIKDKRYREQEEKKAMIKGYHIDQDYVDPDVWSYVK